ncbi:kelch-like protein 13 isoform X5 [Sminthopsis crassicaudata]|uniref:kelch-like protein 13 isoform X5 n=1 Tax=Sminthopsis crassicaudata TaxID=9301 RepID=UPI003D696644
MEWFLNRYHLRAFTRLEVMDHSLPRGNLVSLINERSLVEEEDPHMKVSLVNSDIGMSAHLQSSKTGTTRFFSSNTHSSVVLQGFDQLRVEGLLCDVSLVPGDGDEAFPVHRAMMASASDYFKAMFTGGMKEQDLMCIKLHGVNKVGLKKIIDFIYTAKLSLNMDNLQDTLEAASFLQILPILDFCKVFLISGVSLDNCVEVGRIANTYNLTEVDKYVNNFILKNFLSILNSGEFVKLPFERLAFVLSSNSLKHCSELDLFKAACRWLRSDDLRMEFASKLMKNIRFPMMSPQDLINYVQAVDFMRTDNTCVNLLLEASNYQMMPYMQPVMQSERTAIRSDSTHLVTLGGVLRQQLVVSKELRMYDEKSQEWKSLAPMDAPRYQHGIAVIGNFLYVVGGQSNYDTKGKTAVDTVFRFDPRYNKWMQVASLNEKRTFFHLSALKGHLYAVGGRNAAGELEMATAAGIWKRIGESHMWRQPVWDSLSSFSRELVFLLKLLFHLSKAIPFISLLVPHSHQSTGPCHKYRERRECTEVCNIASDIYQLCDSGQVALPLWASVASSVKLKAGLCGH